MSFLVRPKLLPGESLSSWRQRSARDNGFLWYPEGPSPYGNHDPDRLPNQETQAWLAEGFNARLPDLKNASLNAFEGLLFVEGVQGPYLQWIVPGTSRGHSQSSSGAFCPWCLAEGKTPYFRLEWRLAFMTHCPVHACRLLDRCPSCGFLCWPAPTTIRSRMPGEWRTMAQCFNCGCDLRSTPVVVDEQSTSSRMLLHTVFTRSLPDGAPKEITVTEYFSALWLLARLARRHLDQFLPHLPDRCHPPVDVLSAGLRGKLEMLRVEQRIAPVSSAMWLLEDWPDRFITTAKAAGITGEDFIRTASSYPPWLEVVLREHFLQQNKWLGREEVEKAVGQLTAGGLKVSKNALRRTLSVSENWAINELLDQRRKATVGELNALCKKFEKLIQITPAARDQQRTLARDFLILLISAFAERKIEELCRMSGKDVAQLLIDTTGTEAKGPPMKSARALLLRLHDQYAHGIRPHFIVRGEQPKTWFLSRFGAALDGHSVRDQIAKLMKHEFDPALWCSADVFQGAVTRQPPRRRSSNPGESRAEVTNNG